MRLPLLVILLCTSPWLMAQKAGFWHVGLANHGTGLPVANYPALFHRALHPGVWVQYGLRLNTNDKHQWAALAMAGVHYHRFVQTLVSVAPHIQYRYQSSAAWSVHTSLGIGYGASFWNTARFRHTDNGYERISPLVPRSQWIAQWVIGAGYLLKNSPRNASLTLGFQSLFSGPFVKKYVPVLPINALMLGYSFHLQKS